MKIGIFTGVTGVRSKNIFTDISRYPTGKHEINVEKALYVEEIQVRRTALIHHLRTLSQGNALHPPTIQEEETFKGMENVFVSNDTNISINKACRKRRHNISFTTFGKLTCETSFSTIDQSNGKFPSSQYKCLNHGLTFGSIDLTLSAIKDNNNTVSPSFPNTLA